MDTKVRYGIFDRSKSDNSTYGKCEMAWIASDIASEVTDYQLFFSYTRSRVAGNIITLIRDNGDGTFTECVRLELVNRDGRTYVDVKSPGSFDINYQESPHTCSILMKLFKERLQCGR